MKTTSFEGFVPYEVGYVLILVQVENMAQTNIQITNDQQRMFAMGSVFFLQSFIFHLHQFLWVLSRVTLFCYIVNILWNNWLTTSRFQVHCIRTRKDNSSGKIMLQFNSLQEPCAFYMTHIFDIITFYSAFPKSVDKISYRDHIYSFSFFRYKYNYYWL